VPLAPSEMPARLDWAFATGSIATGLYSTIPGFLLLIYLTDLLGVSPALAPIAVFVPKLWSVIADPLAGRLYDQAESQSRRSGFMIAGMVATALGIGALFSIAPTGSPALALVLVTVVFIICTTGYSIFSVPYLATPASLALASERRTRLIGRRMMLAILGIILGAAGAPVLIEFGGGGVGGYALMSIVVGLVSFAAMLVAIQAVSRMAPWTANVQSATSFKVGVRIAFQDKLFRSLMVQYGLIAAGLGSFTAALPYLFKYVLHRSASEMGLFFVAMLGISFVSITLWTWLAKRFGKHKALIAGCLTFAIGTIIMALAPAHGLSHLFIAAILIGTGFGATQILPFAIAADAIADLCADRGVSAQSLLSGIWVSCEKVTLAFGSVIVGAILSFAGFVEAQSGESSVQSATALLGIVLVSGVIPAILTLAATPLLFASSRLRMPIEDRR
jgi:glycoside/pentoside/hexuronide:cation symporter, GPH family